MGRREWEKGWETLKMFRRGEDVNHFLWGNSKEREFASKIKKINYRVVSVKTKVEVTK